MSLQPLGNRIIVRPVEVEEQSAGGVFLPSQAQEKDQRGEVVSVGEKVEVLKPGDEILFSKYGGTEVSTEGEELLFLLETDVLARENK